MSKCEKCGKEIESTASFCMNCGSVNNNVNNASNNNGNKGDNKWFYVLIVFFVLFVSCFFIGMIFMNTANKVSDNTTTTTMTTSDVISSDDISTTTTTTTAIPTTTTTTAVTSVLENPKKDKYTVMTKIMFLINNGLAYDTGSYAKGEVAKGEYAFVSLSSGSKYYEEEDLSGNIIDNENFDSFGYVIVHGKGDITTRGVLISIKAFNSLGVSGAKELYEILNEVSDYDEAGFYKVGNDIPAGTYIIESYGSGYFAVLSGPVGNSNIVRNDNFSGKKTVSVKNGQYLEVHRATLIKQ